MSKSLRQFTEFPDLELIHGAAGLEQGKKSGSVLRTIFRSDTGLWVVLTHTDLKIVLLLCHPKLIAAKKKVRFQVLENVCEAVAY